MKGNPARQYELALEYVRAYEKSPGLNSVRFAPPQAPVNRWRIRIPQRGVRITIQPMIAATEVPPSAQPATPEAEETTVMAFVGSAPEVRIDWTPKTEGAAGLEALATVEAQHEVTLEEGMLPHGACGSRMRSAEPNSLVWSWRSPRISESPACSTPT